MKINLLKYETLLVSLVILLGLLLRGYSINFNDFWSDEMVSFYLSNPDLNFKETMTLIFESNLTLTFEFVLKFFHKINAPAGQLQLFFKIRMAFLTREKPM